MAVDDHLLRARAEGVPLSRIYEVIDEAERRAAAWKAFAGVLSSRVMRS